jgi:hypothetical protein
MSEILNGPLLDVADAQTYLGGISRSQLYELRAAGLVKFVKIGRRSFVPRASLDAYVAELSAA